MRRLSRLPDEQGTMKANTRWWISTGLSSGAMLLCVISGARPKYAPLFVAGAFILGLVDGTFFFKK